jgi:hypothetical protein
LGNPAARNADADGHAAVKTFLFATLLSVTVASTVQAQKTEEPDPTRLDVERLPPEAIQSKRLMFAEGFGVEGHLGFMAWVSGLSQLLDPGFYASIAATQDIFSWFSLRVGLELSLHPTDAPPPPREATLEFVSVVGEARLQWPLLERLTLWGGAQIGAYTIFGDVLSAYGVTSARDLGPFFGGNIGMNWHLMNRHQSMGVATGYRIYPSLDVPSAGLSSALTGTLYIRHVF